MGLSNWIKYTHTPFFQLETMSKQVENIKAGLSPKDYVESMRSQGSALLHEMLHTEAKSDVGGQGAGILQPRFKSSMPFYHCFRLSFLHPPIPPKLYLTPVSVDVIIYPKLTSPKVSTKPCTAQRSTGPPKQNSSPGTPSAAPPSPLKTPTTTPKSQQFNGDTLYH